MIMSTMRLRAHLEPLLEVPSVATIRIGTKSLAYWPARFTTDSDADDLLRLFDKVIASGRTLAVMAHVSHPRELSTDTAREAIGRIRSTGAVIYCQAPVMAHVNDHPTTWATMWRAQLALGAVPYYMFVARDTGPQAYFKVPLDRAWSIFNTAYTALPGLARTVRGPVLSTTPGKVLVDHADTTPDGQTALHLRFVQARDPRLVGRPFRAHMPQGAAWLDELQPLPATPSDLHQAIATA
jgi:L-lysine 2,3-aminomutase